MLKALSNEQRQRLEMITNDEFSIKQREIVEKRKAEYDAWVKAEEAKVRKMSAITEYAKAYKKSMALGKKLRERGISVNFKDGGDLHSVHLIGGPNTYSNSGDRAYPGIKDRQEKTKVNYDDFVRAKNEVLSVIWSMEHPFEVCVKMIKDKIAKIK